jgi:hypothetical protein
MKVQPTTKELIEMLYERLPELFDRAAPVQGPVAWLDPEGDDYCNVITASWKRKMQAMSTRLEQEHAAKHTVPVYATPPAAPAAPVASNSDPFLQGVCVALQAVTGSGDGVLWREIVEAAGSDELLQYAAHIEPEEWELAGFSFFAKSEMGRGKPKKLAAPVQPVFKFRECEDSQALAAPVQEPVAWVTVEDGKWVSTRSADFRHITDGQYQLYVGPLAYEVPAAIKTLEALGYTYEDGEQWTAPPAQPAPCTWTKSADLHMPDTFNSSCGVVWTFTDGGPGENNVRFCPGCGSKVVKGGAA